MWLLVASAKRRKVLLISGLALGCIGSGIGMLILTILVSLLAVIGSGSVATAVTVSGCGVNRAPVTVSTSDAPTGSLAQVLPGSLVVPMASGTYTIASPFGMRWGALHDGQDYAAPRGTPIYAAGDGEVVEAGPADGYGLWIRIRHTIDTKTVETLYGHMDSVNLVSKGQHVTAGQQIAVVGNNGQSTGPHLHFGVYPGGWKLGGGVDPLPWLKQESAANPAPPSTTPAVAAATTSAANAPASQPKPAPAKPVSCAAQPSTLKDGTVPAKYVNAVRQAGQVCPEITAPVIAADIEAESGWEEKVVSKGDGVNGGGAMGMAQFMPGTWQTYGTDSGLDTEGKPNGADTPDPYNGFDAIASQAKYLCHIAGVMRDALDKGKVTGDLIDLTLAGYNAGEGAVLANHGIPPFPQTQKYVPKIRALMLKYSDLGASSSGTSTPITVAGSAFAQAMIAAASKYVGAPYVWGGGNSAGPTTGDGQTGETGFDCSGLVLYAVAQASQQSIQLPHLTTEQMKLGQPVSISDIAPGDVVFSNSGGHVGIWMGDGKTLEALDRGKPLGLYAFDLSRAESVRRFGS